MSIYKLMIAGLVLSVAILAGLGTLGTSTRVSDTFLEDIRCDGAACSIEFEGDVDVAKALDTGSMLPTFDDDILIITKPEDLRIGDIVLYRSDSNLIVHRIVDMEQRQNGWYYRIKGDNNMWDDGWFHESAIEWKVIGVLY